MERVFARRTRGGGGPGQAGGRGGVPTLGGAQGRTSLARKPPYDFATPGEGRENPGSRLFFPPPGAGLKKKKKKKSIMEAKLPWNLTLLPLHFWVSGTQTALLWYKYHAYFFFLIFFFFLSFSFKSCFTTLHLHFTYNFSHNHHNSSHINRPGVVSPFYSIGNWGSEGLNNGLWLPK